MPPGESILCLRWLAYCAHSGVFVHMRACAPLGCPPLQGSEGSQQNFTGVLETALKLAHQDADAEDEEGGGQRAAAAKVETLQILSQMAWLGLLSFSCQCCLLCCFLCSHHCFIPPPTAAVE